MRAGVPIAHRLSAIVSALAVLALLRAASAETPSTAPPAGIRENTPAVHALTHARIVVAPGRVIPSGTLVMRDGVIEACGAGVQPPADAVVHDLHGQTVYPGLIDAYTELGMGAASRVARSPSASYWNPQVTPQLQAEQVFSPDSLAAKTLRDQGVTVVLTAPAKGIIKGTSAIVHLGAGTRSDLIVKPEAALHVSLTVVDDTDEYPTSPMGAYTLVRQAFYDADWYSRAWAAWQNSTRLPRPDVNEALEALRGYAGGPKLVVIDTENELYALRADRIARELGLKAVVRGSGREYLLLDKIHDAGWPILVPVNFPEPPAVGSPEEAASVELEDLMHWDLAPENPGRLARAGVRIALTSDGLKDQGEFMAGVRRAVVRGLSRDEALRALTVTPAEIFGLDRKLGTLDPGKVANLVITDGDLFADSTHVVETWIEGRRNAVRPTPRVEPRGTWELALAGEPAGPPATLKIAGEPDKLTGTLSRRADVELQSVRMEVGHLAFSFSGDSIQRPGMVRMSAVISGGEMIGEGEWPDGRRFEWTASRRAGYSAPPDTAKKPVEEMSTVPVLHPFSAFGRAQLPEQPAVVVFRGATVWTSGPRGRIENGTVIVRRGKIAAVGKSLPVPAGARVVELEGKHLTPGIIDCHSHTATDGGVNESGQTVSAEVRIGDFINPNDTDIYRQLAGGVIAAHVLHGSANTIGGQCQLIKMRWGMGPEEMKFEGWTPTIKFALGENVKQSNWGDRYVTRYPQTRMGVEQLIRDEFQAARDYKRAREEVRAGRSLPVRRDLELDAISQVLDGKLLIHCHSYRQDEILMLMRVCDDFGVHLGAFQHVLEGYKVADEMAKRGIGGSTFSDWWAYKIEVADAIPYNGALMHDAGVVVSYNSDSDELARRLNTEAAKAVKYGGVSEEEALKFVTLNPAKQLHVEDRVGSIEPGKDADLAVWSGSPLSTQSVCEQTWIDGRRYFDRDEDRLMRADREKLRASLVQKALKLSAGKGAGSTKKSRPAKEEESDDEVGKP
jgi:imidazolonepropionase-like amidohydrolase